MSVFLFAAYLGVRQAKGHLAPQLSHHDVEAKGGVSELLHPRHGIKHRMVISGDLTRVDDAGRVEARDTYVMDEYGVVGAAAQNPDLLLRGVVPDDAACGVGHVSLG